MTTVTLDVPAIEFERETDMLYVRLREGEVARTKEFGDLRHVDVDADGLVIGVEFVGASGGIELEDLPEAEALAVALNTPFVAATGLRVLRGP
jgi:uncharacterized protein YuzE